MTIAICILSSLLSVSVLMNLALHDILANTRERDKEFLDYLREVIKAVKEQRERERERGANE